MAADDGLTAPVARMGGSDPADQALFSGNKQKEGLDE